MDSRHPMWRKTTLHRLLHYNQLCQAEARLHIKKGQLKYAFEYMKQNAGKFVKQGDLLMYCDKRRSEDTNGAQNNFKDNSRAIESLRKDKLPLEWIEVKKGKELWFKYCPDAKERYTEDVIEKHMYKKDSFTNDQIRSRIELAGHRCEITGIPVDLCKTDADHFIPREKGGLSILENCVILSSHLNTSKNSKMPVDWFSESILRNFLHICNRVGIVEEAKSSLISFIQKFEE